MTRRIRWSRLGILAVLGVAALFALRYFDLHPIDCFGEPEDAQIHGRLPDGGGRRDLVVWIDSESIRQSAQAKKFSALDLSCAWFSLLEGRMGRVGTFDGVTIDALAAPRAVIVTSSIADRVGPERVDAWLRAGATVLVDAHADGSVAAPWLEAARIAPRGPVDSHAPDLAPLLHESLATEWSALRFCAPPTWIRYAATDDATSPVTRDRDAIAFVRAVGRGKLVVAAVPLARWWCRLSQGQPEDDFSIASRFGDYEDILEPDDLALDAAQRECEVPFSDHLAEAFVALLDPPEFPLPRLAWYPRDSRGVYLLTHDEDLRGGAEMVALAEQDRRLGIRGTHFVIGHPRLVEDWQASHAEAIATAGGALTVHWNRMPTPHGLRKIEPIQWVATLEDQKAWLAPLPIELGWNRNHFLIVGRSWTESSRILAASGVRFDSTFAANKGRGYLFGSALPRWVIDENGFPLPIREVAFHNQENWGGADEAFFERLFARNAAENRGAIVSIFHPPKVLREPTPPALIERAAKAALASGHASLTAPEYGRFVDDRWNLEFGSERTPDGTLTIAYSGAKAGLDFLVPTHGARLEASGSRAYRETVGGVEYLRIEIPPGTGRIEIRRE